MKWHREKDGRILVNLERGDDLRPSLEGLATELGLAAARVTALGALEDPELGSFDLPTKVYHKKVFPGIWELLSLVGNLSLVDGRPFLHAHVALSGHDFRVFGGHLFEARVGVMVELFLDPYPTPLHRSFSEKVGLNQWEPGR